MCVFNTTSMHVSLSDNEINDQGIQVLVGVLTFHTTHFEKFYICHNISVYNSVVDILVGILLRNLSLKKLYLTDCTLFKSDKDRLKHLATSTNEFILYI